jgi:hypothetical protein
MTIKKSLQVLQNSYEHTRYDDNYKINLPISSLFFFNSRDETAHNDIILNCDLHNDVILHCDFIIHSCTEVFFPTISYLGSEDNTYFQGP